MGFFWFNIGYLIRGFFGGFVSSPCPFWVLIDVPFVPPCYFKSVVPPGGVKHNFILFLMSIVAVLIATGHDWRYSEVE